MLLIVIPFLLILFILFIFTGTAVFQIVFGVDANRALIIFILILFGSLINIPVYEREGIAYEVRYRILGLIYTVRKQRKIIVAINLGGCFFPIILAFKAFYDLTSYMSLTPWLVVLILTSLVVYSFAKPIPGVGIVVPMLIPPLAAAFFSFLMIYLFDLPLILLPKLAFSTGVFSTLFGADIFHLKDLDKIGSGVVSIGGAGTFDGIFLTGIFAVVLSVLFI